MQHPIQIGSAGGEYMDTVLVLQWAVPLGAAVKAGEMQYTVLQPVATFSAEAVKQADNFIKTGKTGAASEKQLFDCVLVTKDNADQFTAPFTMKQ